MLTSEQKAQIHLRLQEAGIKAKKEIFDAINQGATLEQVDAIIARKIEEIASARKPDLELSSHPISYKIFGKKLITQNAVDDMNFVTRLPFVSAAALMPDGHRVKENSVPVGGVVASTHIFPSIVGSDIACSVMLSIVDCLATESDLQVVLPTLKYVLSNFTYFNNQLNPDVHLNYNFYLNPPDMETEEGKNLLRAAMGTAATQHGTSGDGNHFVEIGLTDVDYGWGKVYSTKKTRRIAILSHFGSRAVGSLIAKAFNTIAMSQYEMPKGVEEAPLDVNSPYGRDYIKLMHFAADFARTGHEWVHRRVSEEISARINMPMQIKHQIYSRHNFADYDVSSGLFIHRKGATPAHAGLVGVIPATMGHQTQIVLGLGNPESLNSASHGAGRTHSRGRALQEFKGTHDYVLRNFGVHLIGGDADEDPRAYKPISEVMFAQAECVYPLGTFQPFVVRMANPRF